MGLFTKKKHNTGYTNSMPKLPTLPELPGHAEFPEIPEVNKPTPGELLNLKNESSDIHKLPSFPTSSVGEQFSQNTIKTAVGLPENSYEYDETEDTDEDMPKMVHEKIKKPVFKTPKHIEEDNKQKEIISKVKSTEPIFIRIDKFEESLKIFKTAKGKISEIEELLKNTKEIKKDEQAELTRWEDEILQLKMQIEKVDEDIFSKID